MQSFKRVKISRKWAIMLVILFLHQTLFSQDITEQVRHVKTNSGLEFGLWGGNGEVAPAPLLFILASTIDETLGDEYFRQCGTRLAKEKGWLCVSLDLPYHGKFRKENAREGLDGWADAVRQGEDFVSDNNARMQEILEYLINKGYVDEKNIAVCGTSRGGYLALQFAANEERVKSAIVFAPVTELSELKEFVNIDQGKLVEPFLLNGKIAELAKKKVWMVIGDNDQRVGTDQAIQLARNISLTSYRNNTSGEVELNVMYEPKGHTTPKGAVNRSVDWVFEKHNVPFRKVEWDSTVRPDIFRSRVEMYNSLPQSKEDIVFLGNSITFWGNWQELTGLPQVKNRGIPGDNTFGVLERIDEIINGAPAKIFILIGINDLANHIPDSIILSNYQKIIDRIKSGSPSTKIYFQTMLPTNDIANKQSSIYSNDGSIIKINNSLKLMAVENNLFEVIDIYKSFSDENGKLAIEYTWDGIHLNLDGYLHWISILKNGKYL